MTALILAAVSALALARLRRPRPAADPGTKVTRFKFQGLPTDRPVVIYIPKEMLR